MLNLPVEMQKKVVAQVIAKDAAALLFSRMDAESMLIQMGCEKEKATAVIESVLTDIAADFEKNVIQQGYKPQAMVIVSGMKG